MAVDATMLTPMLDPFRGMLAECEGKGLDGKHVDAMRATLARLEQLGAECADITEFTAKVTTENLFAQFSDAYGKALAGAAQAKGAADAGDDDAMLASMLDAYRDARRQAEAAPDNDAHLEAMDRAIALGESGLSFPVFLRRLEEEGLSDAIQGSTMTRAGIVKEVHFAADAHDPVALDKAMAMLAAYDELAADAKFGAPSNLAYTLTAHRVDWEYAPREAEWAWVQDRWGLVLSMVVDWLDAFAKFAPYDERWRTPGASEKQVKENIRRDQECLPGYLAVRLSILRDNHGLSFDDIFTHASFENELAANRIEYSDARLELLRDTISHMTPGSTAPKELVARTEALHDAGDHVNPRLGERVTLPVPEGLGA